MSGYVGDLSPQQEKALAKLKEAVVDIHVPKYDDHYYLRWLRARNFDVSKAETMIRKNLAFRRKIGADTILTDYKPHQLIDKYYPRSYLGPDKEGCPVRLMPFKNLDLRGFVYSVKKSEVLKFLTYLFEQDIQEMERVGKERGIVIEKHSYIIDIDGYTFRQASNSDALGMLNDVLKMYEANYPERMKTCYFINVPTYFNIILNLSKPFLSEATIQKFKIFGKDFKQALLNDIDAEILPKYLGGTRTDPDGNPMCKTIVNYGSMIPLDAYVVKNSVRSMEQGEGVKMIKVTRQNCQDVEIPVLERGTKIEWTFETPSRDIAVGLYYKRSEEESNRNVEELLAPERVSCHLVPESESYLCDRPGIYILRFDNSYSWVVSKKVFYRYNVIRPNEREGEVEDFI